MNYSCGCREIEETGRKLLCGYHQGYEDGMGVLLGQLIAREMKIIQKMPKGTNEKAPVSSDRCIDGGNNKLL